MVERSREIDLETSECVSEGAAEELGSTKLTVRTTAHKPARSGGQGWSFEANLALVLGEQTVGIDLLGSFRQERSRSR